MEPDRSNEVLQLSNASLPGISPKIEEPVGLSLLLGGTSVRALVTSKDLSKPVTIFRIPWQKFARLPWTEGRDIAPLADEFTAYLAGQICRTLTENGIKPEQVKVAGASIAGNVNKNGTTLISSTNTAVEFKNYPFPDELLRHLNRGISLAEDEKPKLGTTARKQASAFGFNGIEADNDGRIATLGELLHEDGLLRGRKGFFIIWGTGIGGSDSTLSITELGHILLFNNEAAKYQFMSLDELQAQGCHVDGKWVACPPAMTYLEHRLAGPWLAIRFLKTLGDSVELFEELSGITGIARSDLEHLSDLPKQDRYRWAINIKDSQILPLNRMIFGVGLEHHTAAEDTHGKQKELVQALWRFKKSICKDMGKALRVLREQYPDHRIVLGSGVAEALSADPNFITLVKHFASSPSERLSPAKFLQKLAKGTKNHDPIGPDIVISKMEAEARETAPVRKRLIEWWNNFSKAYTVAGLN